MNKLPVKLIIVSLLTIGFLPRLAFAQDKISSGVAISIAINGDIAENGDIISLTSSGYSLTNVAYDPNTFGVVSTNPAVSFEKVPPAGSYPVISFGKVYTRVTTQNGIIKIGDLVTSSPVAGVGQKSTADGFILGSALENYEENDQTKVGLILVNLKPQLTVGKNPLVIKTVGGGILPNILLTTLVVAGGLFLAFLILVL